MFIIGEVVKPHLTHWSFIDHCLNLCNHFQIECLLGACVIDRDGHLFKYLLDYLHGEVQIPTDEQALVALQEEANYIGIPNPDSLSDHLVNEIHILQDFKQTFVIRMA